MFDKNWFLKNQKLLLWLANIRYGKDILGHGLDKVDLILPNAVFQRLDKNTYKAEFRTHNKYSKRLFYEYKPIWKVFHWFDERVANIYIPRLNLGFDTLIAQPVAGANSPIDGTVLHTQANQTFDVLREAAGSAAATSDATPKVAQLVASTVADTYNTLLRSIFCFNTSSLGGGATISVAVFSLEGAGGDASLGATTYDVVSAAPAATNNLVAGDYDSLGTTVFGDFGTTITSGSYEDVTLDANGIANINKTDISKFGVRLGWDTDDSFGGTWVSAAETYETADFADQTGTSSDPKLTVTFTLAGSYAFFM